MKPNPSTPRRRWLRHAARWAGGGWLLTAPGARLLLAAPLASPSATSSASPFASLPATSASDPVASAATGVTTRLVVVLLRGALDGLAAVPAPGDPGWADLRPAAAAGGELLPLDGLFAMHPALPTLHRWYGEGSLLVAHAVGSPYRERSHFDAQQLLESGGSRPFERSTGWLARALQAAGLPAVSLTPGLPVGLRGADGATSWAPMRQHGADDDLLDRVARLLAEEPDLGAAFDRAREQRRGAMGDDRAAEGRRGFVELAHQAGRFLAADGGPPVAWLESQGWDTHTAQAARLGRLLPVLDEGLAALRTSLGHRWADTVVLVVTEFGRTAALNGSGGTDHGSGGVAWVAGGPVAGGRVRADWPGLRPAELLDRRDLRATQDLRGLFKAVVERQLGVPGPIVDREVLPGAPPAWGGLWRA